MRFFLVTFFVFFITLSTAQQQNEQQFTSNAKTIFIELTSLNELSVKSSKKSNVITVKCSNCSSEAVPKIVENDDMLTIKVFEDTQTIYGAQRNKFRAGQPEYANYSITLPENKDVKIVYNKGNFKTSKFKGSLEVHLNHGNVTVKEVLNDITISSYDGIIDCSLTKGDIRVENSKGNTNSKLAKSNLKLTKNNLKGVYKRNTPSIKIKTVRAKVVLSPVITQ